MDGRFPLAIRTTFTRCTDPAQETALNTWYGREHRPRLKATGRLSEIVDVTYRGTFRVIRPH